MSEVPQGEIVPSTPEQVSQEQNEQKQCGMPPSFTPRVAIPPAASEEIKRLHIDMVTKGKAFESARVGFNEFIRGTRMALNIPDSERDWLISADATAFERQPTRDELRNQ